MSTAKQNPIDLNLRDTVSYVKKFPYESGSKLDGRFHYYAVDGITVVSLRYDKDSDKIIINESEEDELILPSILPQSLKNEYFFSNEAAVAYGKRKNEEVFEEVSEFVKSSLGLQSFVKQLIEEGC